MNDIRTIYVEERSSLANHVIEKGQEIKKKYVEGIYLANHVIEEVPEMRIMDDIITILFLLKDVLSSPIM